MISLLRVGPSEVTRRPSDWAMSPERCGTRGREPRLPRRPRRQRADGREDERRQFAVLHVLQFVHEQGERDS